MKKAFLLACSFVVALAWATPARAADIILFDPDGDQSGGAGDVLDTEEVVTFDWNVGNSLVIEETTIDPTTGEVVATGRVLVLYQSNLSVATDDNGDPVFTNSDEDIYFHAVAGFYMDLDDLTVNPDGSVTVNFTPDATADSFFHIYADDSSANNLTGDCFVCDELILSAVLIDDPTNSSTFTTDSDNIELLDQFLGDDWNGTDSITGTGGTTLNLLVTFVDGNYFLDLVAFSTLVFTNTSQILPYLQTNPSMLFSLDGTTMNADTFDPTSPYWIGTCNGCPIALGGTFNSLAQSDANTSFTQQAVVPEPATLTLLGLGLVGSAMARRRQLKKKNRQPEI